MNTSNSCPKCGATLQNDALCPACLMSGAIPSDSEATMKLTGANVIAKGAALPSMFPFEFGGYRVIGLLGRGGMGAVYEAEQMESGRRVALKVLGHGMDSEEMRKRFLREGRLAAAVSHPNSIYIFGTEEIEGAPVIVMEIAGGGTLKDELKRRGPLPVKDAVDAMLQIIAGLEAAHAGGVLHRDVKPANCFISPDGTAKVGDFGLSVSTLARTDTQLTASGMMLGTPSFAPPEQLRGDELDVRADIYSVGATLYTLLTGKAPFEGENAVQVVAAVLDKAPRSVTEFRKGVPAALAQSIARCMAKKREARFANYAALREALLPLSSAVPEPAPLGLRFLAGFADDLIASLPALILGTALSVEFADRFLSVRTLASFLPWLGEFVFYVACFAVTEGVWGAGLGKAVCGLRVVGPDGNAPGIGRALLRVLFFNALALSLLLPLLLTSGPEYAQLLETDGWLGKWWFWAPLVFFFALFSTMRRCNGFAALQDLVSGTRVVVRTKSNARPRPEIAAVAEDEVPADGGRIGPFIVVKTLDDGWLRGFDPMLRRRVWIMRDAGFQSVNGQNARFTMSEARRDIARPGRLRWLAGTEDWNAFEAPGGQTLLAFEKQSQPWALVRCWLADLAEEIAAGEKDGTLPASASLQNIWITRDGRAVLLDEPVAGLSAETGAVFDFASTGSAQKLLDAVVRHVLDPKTLPLHAHDFLKKLAVGSFDRMSFVAGNLQSLLARPATISHRRRATSLLLVPAFLMACFALLSFSIQFDADKKDAQWSSRGSGLPPVSTVLRLRAASDPSEGFLFAWRPKWDVFQATGIHLVAHYLPPAAQADMLQAVNSELPLADQSLPLSDDERGEIAAIFHAHWTAHPAPQAPLKPEQITAADALLSVELPQFLDEERRRPWINGFRALRNILGLIAIIQIFSLLFFGATLGQKVFGFAVVNKKGERAGRLRMLGRWFLAWVPFLLAFAIIEVHAFTGKPFATHEIVKVSLFGLMWVLGVIAAIAKPSQGVHDDQAKTWLVPR